MTLWITAFPLPPSINEYLIPVSGRMKTSKTGKSYRGSAWVKTAKHRLFEEDCLTWRYKNHSLFKRAFDSLRELKDIYLKDKKPFVLRVDTYFVFHYKRVWALDGAIKRLDADNRLKPCLDAISRLFEIDDSHFFAGGCEKVTTDDKAAEGAYIRISIVAPRKIESILNIVASETEIAS